MSEYLSDDELNAVLTDAAQAALKASEDFTAGCYERSVASGPMQVFDPVSNCADLIDQRKRALMQLAELWLKHHDRVRLSLWLGTHDDSFIQNKEVIRCYPEILGIDRLSD